MRFNGKDSTFIYLAMGLTPDQIKGSRSASQVKKNEPQEPKKIDAIELYSSLHSAAETIVANASKRRRRY